MTKGQRIKAKREALKISQTDLATSIGVSKQTLYKYENDIVTNIPSNIIELLADRLMCSPAYIMGWDAQDSIEEITKRLSNLSSDGLREVLKFIDYIESKEGKS